LEANTIKFVNKEVINLIHWVKKEKNLIEQGTWRIAAIMKK
jgi:hypothetical protein